MRTSAAAHELHRTVLAALLMTGLLGGSPCRADSALESAPRGPASVRAQARLDFRITVLPMLSLRIGPERTRIEANSGTITLQHDVTAGRVDGLPAARNMALQAHREIVVHDVSTTSPGAGVLTVASP